ncbi:maleylacetoacetate isomerase [Celeribacter sp.]|uniref:maleylacetoacetate isomerase n=1 Tax=Celeribacter sp. TaxID=1890673 RepID=UPI003A939E0F
MITLFDYWRSSASYRVRIGLNLTGETWTSSAVDLLANAQRGGENLERNPQGLVPSIEIDGTRFTQSLAILEYLDETRALGLLPTDPVGRAKTRALAHAIAMDIHPVCNLRVVGYAATASSGQITKEAWMHHFIAQGLAEFEAMLEGGDFCYGDHLTLADICLVPQVYNAERWGVDMTGMPKIRRVAAHLATFDAVLAAHPDKTPH